MVEGFKQFEHASEKIDNELLIQFTPKEESRYLTREEVESALILISEGKNEVAAVKELRADDEKLTLARAKSAFKAAKAYLNKQQGQ